MVLAWLGAVALGADLMVAAENAIDCSVAIDGKDYGKLPLHTTAVAPGEHSFRVTCPDGRTASAIRSFAEVAGGMARVELAGLAFTAPAVETGPVPTYVVPARIVGGKVSIDGGPPTALPARVTLNTGPHVFVVTGPDGTKYPAQTVDVVAHDGQAVVKLQ